MKSQEIGYKTTFLVKNRIRNITSILHFFLLVLSFQKYILIYVGIYVATKKYTGRDAIQYFKRMLRNF